MNKDEAIEYAVALMRTAENANLAKLVDFSRVSALYIDMEQELAEMRLKWPHIKHSSTGGDFWIVRFPLIEEGFDQRTDICVKVNPISKIAKVMPDL